MFSKLLQLIFPFPSHLIVMKQYEEDALSVSQAAEIWARSKQLRSAQLIPSTAETRMFSIYIPQHWSWKWAISAASWRPGFREWGGHKKPNAVPVQRQPRCCCCCHRARAFVPSHSVAGVIENRCGQTTRFRLSNKGWKLHFQNEKLARYLSASLPSLYHN